MKFSAEDFEHTPTGPAPEVQSDSKRAENSLQQEYDQMQSMFIDTPGSEPATP